MRCGLRLRGWHFIHMLVAMSLSFPFLLLYWTGPRCWTVCRHEFKFASITHKHLRALSCSSFGVRGSSVVFRMVIILLYFCKLFSFFVYQRHITICNLNITVYIYNTSVPKGLNLIGLLLKTQRRSVSYRVFNEITNGTGEDGENIIGLINVSKSDNTTQIDAHIWSHSHSNPQHGLSALRGIIWPLYVVLHNRWHPARSQCHTSARRWQPPPRA